MIRLGWSLVKPDQIDKKNAVAESQDATGWLEEKIVTQQVKIGHKNDCS